MKFKNINSELKYLIENKKYEIAEEKLIIYLENYKDNEDTVQYIQQLYILQIYLKKYEDSLRLVEYALKIEPENSDHIFNAALIYYYQNKFESCIKLLVGIVKKNKKMTNAYYYIGLSYTKINKYKLAKLNFFQCLKNDNNYYLAFYSIGNIYFNINKFDEAVKYYNKALKIEPHHFESLFNKAVCEKKLTKISNAINSYKQIINLFPTNSKTYFNLAILFEEIGDYIKSIENYNIALNYEENYIYYYNLGSLFLKLKKNKEALNYFLKCYYLNPNYIDAIFNVGLIYLDLKEYNEALFFFNLVIAIDRRYPYVIGYIIHCNMLLCHWKNFEDLILEINVNLKAKEKVIFPFAAQAFIFDEELLFICAKLYCSDKHPTLDKNLFIKTSFKKLYNNKNNKIKIGYICGEFKSHPTMQLLINVIESHDKNRFEIHAFDNGEIVDSDFRKRIINAFDFFHLIYNINDLVAFELIQKLKIDILINLNGYYGEARQNLFAMRPASIQINYLGFPGTIGADYFDYIIADKIVIPSESKKYYSEKILYLPDSYQPNDYNKFENLPKIDKVNYNLPKEAFVFCCFNNSYKITPFVFDIWCNILRKTKNSVLWLLADNVNVEINLKSEAIKRQIDPKRLIFASREPLSLHLARNRLADLFLDTFPYNAHTTASDALYAGLPVLTVKGSTFPGRVSESLLSNLKMFEFIAVNVSEYENKAIYYSIQTEKLNYYKNYLNSLSQDSKHSSTLNYTRNLEKLFIDLLE